MGPAHYAGLWAMKPTPGAVSNTGVIPVWSVLLSVAQNQSDRSPRFDTLGPFGKSVEDIACLLDVLMPDRGFQSRLSLERSTLSIGVSGQRFGPITIEEEALFSQAQDCLGGIVTLHNAQLPLHKLAEEEGCVYLLMQMGMKDAMAKYLEGVEGDVKSLQDIVDFHSQHPVS